MDNKDKDHKQHETQNIPVILDQKQYKVPPGTITGGELRALPTPPIPAKLDIWQEVPGGDDVKIGDNDSVAIKPGTHFYSAPGTINPGAE